MSFRLVFGPRAEEAYEELPFSLLDEFDANMDRLASDPTTLSVPGTFPFPANRMVFHFSIDDHEGGRWDFAAHFRYGSEEQTLHVIALTVLPPNSPA
ncbi:MAG: hypothetical protein C0467_19385 [Planctomycetaceae bacterium]|nr:hypothetical protein [Planctomycetaceae bacterium]